MHKILIFLENKSEGLHPVGLELLSEVMTQTASLNDVEVDALYIGEKLSEDDIHQVKNIGTSNLFMICDSSLKYYDTHYYTNQVIQFLKEHPYDAFLIGSTLIGRDFAPRVSARLHTGLTADATILAFSMNEGSLLLEATRPALGGNIFATILCTQFKPQMATVRPGVFSICSHPSKAFNVTPINMYKQTLSPVEILSIQPNENEKVELDKAPFVIAAGRGVQTKFNDLLNIAENLHVEVAASRAVVDARITSKSRLVGQTGQTIRPKGYIALGISGAVQHLAGMDQSELVVAVNNDPQAPIFNIAHMSFICDANKVIDEILALQKEQA
ncbi:MAG: electron transfer flavoprotein subunit alpha/FixB family protein [Acholeplasmataceae bacterium]